MCEKSIKNKNGVCNTTNMRKKFQKSLVKKFKKPLIVLKIKYYL